MWPRERPARLILFGALLLGFAARAYVVFTDEGINWPDEIYQSFVPVAPATASATCVPTRCVSA